MLFLEAPWTFLFIDLAVTCEERRSLFILWQSSRSEKTSNFSLIPWRGVIRIKIKRRPLAQSFATSIFETANATLSNAREHRSLTRRSVDQGGHLAENYYRMSSCKYPSTLWDSLCASAPITRRTFEDFAAAKLCGGSREKRQRWKVDKVVPLPSPRLFFLHNSRLYSSPFLEWLSQLRSIVTSSEYTAGYFRWQE